MPTLINSNASQKAKDLYAYLVSISGQHMLSGVHNWIEDPTGGTSTIENITGKKPALHGYEFGAIDPAYTTQQIESFRQGVVNAAIAADERGGSITATWHQNYPFTNYAWSSGVQRSTTQAEFDTVVNPASTEYAWLIAEMDKVALYLKQLRDANVSVLWRPYHEMNGAWFWWGAKNNFSALWDIMYNRFTNHHGLNNLIWVWSPNLNNPYVSYSFDNVGCWVGNNKVDVVAADFYQNLTAGDQYTTADYNLLVSLADGKPIAIGENGDLPALTLISGAQNKYIYQMTWANYVDATPQVTLSSFNNSTWVLTEDEVDVIPNPEEEEVPNYMMIRSVPGDLLYKMTVNDSGVWQAELIDETPEPPTGYNDDFNRIDNATTLGTDWTVLHRWGNPTAFGIINNKAYCASGISETIAYRNAGSTDYTVESKVNSYGTVQSSNASLAQLVVRYVDNHNFLTAFAYNSSLKLEKAGNGSYTTLETAGISLAESTDAVLKIEVVGAVIKVYLDGVLKITHTLSTADAAKFVGTSVGMKLSQFGTPTTSARWDDFNVQ